MIDGKNFFDFLAELDNQPFEEYDPDEYLEMLEGFDVDILLNEKRYVHAKTIQAMDKKARSFKQYLLGAWGKNTIECFPLYYSKISTPYDVDETGDIWLSPYVAFEYATNQIDFVRKKHRLSMTDAIASRINPRAFAKKKMRKDLEEQGYTDREISEILIFHFPTMN
jgi:hypothetical protein